MITEIIGIVAAVLLAVFAASLARAGVREARGRRQDRDDLRAWADQRGWSSRADGGGRWAEFLPHGRVFRLRPQIWGSWQGREVTVAGFESTRPAGQYVSPVYRTVVVVRLRGEHPQVRLTELPWTLRDEKDAPQGVSEKFGRRYRVAADPGKVLTPEVMQMTLAARLPAWQVQRGDLIMSWPQRAQADGTATCLDKAAALAGLLERGP